MATATIAKKKPVSAEPAARTLRRLRRTLCSRNAHGRARRAGASLRESQAGQEISSVASANCSTLTPDAPRPLFFAQSLTKNLGGAKDLSEARRPAPHRRPQNQQLPRTSAARRTHGQTPHHRRNRRGTTRRRHRHGMRSAGIRVRRLHGDRRHAPPGTKRLSYAFAGRGSARCQCRIMHFERRHQRSHARLGHQRPHHAIIFWAACSERILIPRWCATFKK